MSHPGGCVSEESLAFADRQVPRERAPLAGLSPAHGTVSTSRLSTRGDFVVQRAQQIGRSKRCAVEEKTRTSKSGNVFASRSPHSLASDVCRRMPSVHPSAASALAKLEPTARANVGIQALLLGGDRRCGGSVRPSGKGPKLQTPSLRLSAQF